MRVVEGMGNNQCVVPCCAIGVVDMSMWSM